MKAQKNQYGEYIVTDGVDRYDESCQATPTGRILEGSRDCGYWAEYRGYGTIDGVPVRAVYLLDHDQSDIEDQGDYDWDTALSNGRIVVDVDKLSEEQYDMLTSQGELTID